MFVVFVVLVAVGCSGDDGAAGEASTTTSSTSTTTTTTEPPIQLIPCPGGLDVVATADTDGDGVGEDLLFARRDGGQVFFVCGPDGGRAIDLPYGVWYVAVDGADVLLGAATIGDGPDEVSALFRRLDFSGRELALSEELVDDVADPIRVAPPPDICDDAIFPTIADADGDGTDDLIGQRFVETDLETAPSLVVCTATGDVDEALVGGMGEVFAVSTGTGDRATIWAGGTTLTGAFLEPYVWVDGWIVPIETADGPLLLSDGFVSDAEFDAYGCADLDGNGVTELVSIEGDLGDGTISWTRRSWETSGATATEVTTDTGTVPAGDVEILGRAVYGDLIPPAEDCGFGDVID